MTVDKSTRDTLGSLDYRDHAEGEPEASGPRERVVVRPLATREDDAVANLIQEEPDGR